MSENFAKTVSCNLGVALEFDHVTAIYFNELHFWSGKSTREDGYIYKTKDEMEHRTGLTRYQQDRARRKLEGAGWITTKLIKANGSPTTHFKINKKIGIVRNSQMELQETYKWNSKKRTKPTNSIPNTEKKETKKDSDESIALMEKTVEAYNRAFNKKVRLTESRKKKLRLRLKDSGTELLAQAINNASKDRFYKNMTIDYIIRSTENVENMANLEPREEQKERDPRDDIL